MNKLKLHNIFIAAILLMTNLASQAALITVTADHGLVASDGDCSISEAIINANDDAQTHVDCLAGTGNDVIELTQDIILDVEYENDATYGRTGTPAISTILTLDGKGFALQRDNSLSCVINTTNSASEFRVLRTTETADLSLQNITIAYGCVNGGRGLNTHGGGLYNRGDFLSLQQVSFKQNKAFVRGGAILHDRGTISLISNSLFVGNTASEGGAIGMANPLASFDTIENSTFSNNTGNIGSVIFMFDSTINTIQNTTFSGNLPNSAIYNDRGTINNLQNTLFDNYTGTRGADCTKLFGAITNGSNNISSDPSSNRGCPGLLATLLDPLTVGDLSDNGGATMTHALLAGSQAIDAGDSNSTTSDQRGFGLNDVRDIGAFEAQVIELCPTALMTDGFNTTVSTADELTQAIECANANGQANGGDSINLTADITLTQEYENDATFGRTGTPTITTEIRFNGNGFTLQRETVAANFRLFRVTNTADVLFDNIILANGTVAGANNLGSGGAIFNQGSLRIENAIVRQNAATLGGALYHNDIGTGDTFIFKSLFKNNSSTDTGRDIYLSTGLIHLIESSTFMGTGNNDSIYLRNSNISDINNSTFSNSGGNAIYLNDGTVDSISNNTFIGSNTAIQSFNSGGGLIMGTIVNLNNNIFKGTTACSTVEIINANSNLADSTSTCDGTTVGSLGAVTNISASLADNNCATNLADGTCIPTYALLLGSNAIDAATNTPTSSDARGFATEVTRDIGAFETHIPVVIAPANVVAESTGATTTVALGTASVTDDETGLTASADNLGPFAIGMTTVNWSVTDSHGFSAVDTQLVNVQAVIAGNIVGLNGSITLLNDGQNSLTLNNNGNFRFTTAMDNLDNYSVTLSQQPATQTCAVANASGQVDGANINNIAVSCSDNLLSLDTTSLDFGTVFTGETGTQTVTLTNNGSNDVTIASYTNPNTPFSIIGGSCFTLPVILMPTQSCTLVVELNATAEGSFNDSFQIISNAATSPITVNLTGNVAIRIIPTLSFYGLLALLLSILGFAYTYKKRA